MISLLETFFGIWTNFGEKTSRSVYELVDDNAGITSEINKDNILIRDEGIGTSKNNYNINI